MTNNNVFCENCGKMFQEWELTVEKDGEPLVVNGLQQYESPCCSADYYYENAGDV